ncbi:hypothetical protein ACP70R_025057 [Stipagrostis hirtigluma subsp. patula]
MGRKTIVKRGPRPSSPPPPFSVQEGLDLGLDLSPPRSPVLPPPPPPPDLAGGHPQPRAKSRNIGDLRIDAEIDPDEIVAWRLEVELNRSSAPPDREPEFVDLVSSDEEADETSIRDSPLAIVEFSDGASPSRSSDEDPAAKKRKTSNEDAGPSTAAPSPPTSGNPKRD